jgi:hypothetical protein
MARFELRKTTKLEVVNQFGLPQLIVKDAEGMEHLLYDADPRFIGLITGSVYSPGPSSDDAQFILEHSRVNTGAEYVFDKDGVLIAKYLPKRPD